MKPAVEPFSASACQLSQGSPTPVADQRASSMAFEMLITMSIKRSDEFMTKKNKAELRQQLTEAEFIKTKCRSAHQAKAKQNCYKYKKTVGNT